MGKSDILMRPLSSGVYRVGWPMLRVSRGLKHLGQAERGKRGAGLLDLAQVKRIELGRLALRTGDTSRCGRWFGTLGLNPCAFHQRPPLEPGRGCQSDTKISLN